MTATEELRRLLDERGVEYETYDPPYPEFSTPTSDITTRWGNASYREWPNGTIRFSARGTTPEQAIAATLGPGTCQQEEGGWSTEGDHARVWLTCGHDCMVETVADLPNFCPECGAKVVTE